MHRETALNCATRIANTLLIQEKIEEKGLAEKIIATADKFAEWLGPDPVRQGWNKAPKPTHPEKCPVCGGEMEDQRETKKSPTAPDARCKKRGKWNDAEKKFDGCQGVIWPPKDEKKSSMPPVESPSKVNGAMVTAITKAALKHSKNVSDVVEEITGFPKELTELTVDEGNAVLAKLQGAA